MSNEGINERMVMRKSTSLLTQISDAVLDARALERDLSKIRINPEDWAAIVQCTNLLIVGATLPDDGKRHLFGIPAELDDSVRTSTVILEASR